MGINDNTVRILQGGLENAVSMHRATLAPNLGHYCDRHYGEEEGSTEEEPCSKTDPEEAQQNAGNL